MIVDCAHYVLGTRQADGQMTLEDAAARRRSGSSFVWIELHEPSDELMAELRRHFGLHELAVEDASRAHQRPKVEAYEDFYLLVFRTARYDEGAAEVRFGEVEIFVGQGYAIAVRHGTGADIAEVRQRVERRPGLLKAGPAAVVWGILDAIVDDYRPVVEGLERDLDDVERAVFVGEEDQTKRIYLLKQEVAGLYRTVHPLLEPLDSLERGAFSQIAPALGQYFRDVNDHVRRVHEEVLAQRDQLAAALDANVALINLRQNHIAAHQNQIVKQLTLMAGVFLPLTFITGFFGQNFGWLTGHLTSAADFVVLGLGGVVGGTAAVLMLFWRGGYL
jgi:magnesium transporter